MFLRDLHMFERWIKIKNFQFFIQNYFPSLNTNYFFKNFQYLASKISLIQLSTPNLNKWRPIFRRCFCAEVTKTTTFSPNSIPHYFPHFLKTHFRPLRSQHYSRMQRQHLLPIELVWELVVCIPTDHLIRLYRSGPTRSTALNIILAKFYHPCVLLEIKRKSMEFVGNVKIATFSYKDFGDRDRYPIVGKEQMLLAQAYEHADRLETVIPKMSEENVFKAATLSIICQIYENLNAATSSVDLPSTHPMIQAACLGMELRKLLNDPALTPESDH